VEGSGRLRKIGGCWILIRMNKSWVLISAALSRSVKSIRDRARHLERQAKMESARLDADRTAGIGA
jgi:hypothetical protein